VVCREGARAHSFYCASELLGIDERDVAAAMTFRSVVAGGETYKVRARARTARALGFDANGAGAAVGRASEPLTRRARSLAVRARPLEKNTRARTHTHLLTPVADGIFAVHPYDNPRRDGVLCIEVALALRGVGADLHMTCSLSPRVVICCTGLARVRGAVQRALCIVRAAASNVRAALQRATCKYPTTHATHGMQPATCNARHAACINTCCAACNMPHRWQHAT
jgi:hypothetical protein